jgi:DNA-binding beta-propeller fold protein YncE
VYRTVLAVLMLAPALVGCGAERAPRASDTSPERDTLLARVGTSLVAVDARTGRTLQRVTLGAHDASLDAVYTAANDGDAGTTTVIATDPVSGRHLRSIEVPGRWVIPVAAGSTPDGAVSGDGKVLALAGSSSERSSDFALLATDLKSQPQRFSLRGRYHFDAMAPDGAALYLSEIRDDGRYRVRAYDVKDGVLRPQVVVEKTALGLLMQGAPVTRAVDPSGSPVHTLYRGGPAGAFVHSLNTQRGTALCIFLPDSKRAGRDWRLALDPRLGVLHALDRDQGTHYVIDPTSGDVTAAPPGAPLPGLATSNPDDARTYAIQADGTIAIRDRAGTRIGTLPSPSPEAQLLAIRRAGS